ncbi:hypothetical protein HB762_27335 (plasmid) [Vibrio campbellii]|uniref:ParB/Sulfiredoxin domain-containing protein n=1 Tax=Vibrio campbellii TaxID=680 RepID=A0ABY5IMZ2_9VIBR|nr:hypothetical protein [Vibrio campbellii]UTZ34980.1 hypothetical protein HB762_27335 [Vibrio campbellii]
MISNNLKSRAASSMARHDSSSAKTIEEKQKDGKKKQFFEEHGKRLDSLKRLIENRDESIPLDDVFSEMGIKGFNEMMSSTQGANGALFTISFEGKEYRLRYKELSTPEDIETYTTISEENGRRGGVTKEILGDLYNQVVLTRGNAVPAFAIKGTHEDGKDEVVDGQCRRFICKDANLKFRYFVSIDEMPASVARKIAHMIQQSGNQHSLLQKSQQMVRVFRQEKYTSFNVFQQEEMLFKSVRSLDIAKKLTRLPQDLFELLNTFLEKDINTCNEAFFSNVANALKPFLVQVSESSEVKTAEQNKRAVGTQNVTHELAVAVEDAYSNCSNEMWNNYRDELKGIIADHIKNTKSGNSDGDLKVEPTELIKYLKSAIKTVLSSVAEGSNASSSESNEPILFDVPATETRKPTYAVGGSKKKPKVTLTLPGFTEDEIQDALKAFQAYLLGKK